MAGDETTDSTGNLASPARIEELFADLGDISADVTSTDTRQEILETKVLLAEAHERGLIDSKIRHLGADDAVEAFVGSVIFASPLLVEDGVFEIADHLFGVTVGGVAVFLLANVAFVVVMTYALLEWTGQDRAETYQVFGLPVRLLMILVVSFVVAAVMMTVWGRAGNWQPPSEALARVSVLWTVGSLGAALGDILADSDPASVMVRPATDADTPASETSSDAAGDRDEWTVAVESLADDLPGGTDSQLPEALSGVDGTDEVTVRPELAADEHMDDGALLAAIQDRLDTVHDAIDESEAREEIRRLQERTSSAFVTDAFDEQIRKYTSRDIAEAFVGSVFFSIPFLVEDGVFDVADYFLSFRLGGFPAFFLLNTVFVLAMIWILVYYAGPRAVRMSRPLFGFIPRRMVGIAIVSFVTAGALMTMWGRVEWSDPVVVVARVSVIWSVASFGGALGDVLPGESSGDDINDDISQLGDRVGDLIEN